MNKKDKAEVQEMIDKAIKTCLSYLGKAIKVLVIFAKAEY